MKNIFLTLIVLVSSIVSVQAQEASAYSYSDSYTGWYSYAPYTDYVHTDYDRYIGHDVSLEPEIPRDNGIIDSVRAAKAYANAFWDEFAADITYNDRNGVQHFMEVCMNLYGQVFEIYLDGKYVIRREEGILLPGVPLPTGGMFDVYIYVDGVVDDEPKVTGNAYYNHIKNGDRISITLRPLEVVKHIPASLSSYSAIPVGVDPYDVRLVDQEGNWVGYYYPWLNGFVLWVDPIRNPFYASIYIEGYNGNFGSILIDPQKQVTKKFKGASFDFSLVGNVSRITSGGPNDSVYHLDGSTYDEDGNVVKAKTFVYENKNFNDIGLWIWGLPENGNTRMDLKVYNVDGVDDELVFSRTLSPTREYDQLEFNQVINLPAGSEGWKNLVLVVTTKNGDLLNNEFNFNLWENSVVGSVYTGQAVIDKRGFSDKGSVANNDANTSRNYTFNFTVSSEGGDVQIFPGDVMTFVEGGASFYASQTVDSTADENRDGAFVIRDGETETFTVVVTISNVSMSGQYRVGLDAVGSVGVKRGDFRTGFGTINNGKG